MSEQLTSQEVDLPTRLATAENIYALLEAAPDSDQATADLITDTAEAYQLGRASEEEAIIADEVGFIEGIQTADHEATLDVLALQPVEILAEASADLEMSYATDELKLLEEELFARMNFTASERAVTANVGQALENHPFLQTLPEPEVEYVSSTNVESNIAVLSEEEKELQKNLVNECLENNDLTALNELLSKEDHISTESLTIVIDKLGTEAFKANSWDTDDPNQSKLEDLKNVLVQHIGKRPDTEKLSYLGQIVEVDSKQYPNFGYVEDMLEENPDMKQDISAMLIEKEAYGHLLINRRDLGIEQGKLVELMYDFGKPEEIATRLSDFKDFVDEDQLQERLYADGKAEVIANNLYNFESYDQRRLFDTLVAQDELYIVIHRLDQFPDIDRTEIVRLCDEMNLAYNLDKPGLLESIPPDEAYDILLKHNQYRIILSRPDLFPDVEQNTLIDLSMESHSPYDLLYGVEAGHYELDMDYVFQKMTETHNQAYAFRMSKLFTDEQRALSVEEAIKAGDPLSVLNYEGELPGYTKWQLVELTIENTHGYQLFYDQKHLNEFPPSDIADAYLRHGHYAELTGVMDKLTSRDAAINEKVVTAFIEKLTTSDELTEAEFQAISSFINEHADAEKMPETLKLANRYMGKESSTALGYKIIASLHGGETIPPEAMEVGVTKSGVKGLEQFGVVCKNITAELMDADITEERLQQILESELYLGLLQKVYRVDISEFGSGSQYSIQSLLEKHQQASLEGRVAPLSSEYTALSTDILTLDDKNTEITVDAYERYSLLRGDIIAAAASLDEAHPFVTKLEGLSLKIKDEAEALAAQADELAGHDPEDKAAFFKAKNITEKQAALQGLLSAVREGKYVGDDFALRSPEAMSHVFDKLEKFESLHSDMRQIIFAWALRKNPSLKEQLKVLSMDPGVEDLGAVSSFVEQIVNQETFGNYFSDKKLATRFKKMTSVRAIDEALVRHQKEAGSVGTQHFSLTPTRGAAMELSGFVADACWAGKYESIAEEFPNITSVIMKRGETGSSSERLVGSAMLIETVDELGEGVLVLRGVNPIENFINKVRVEDFYKTMADYVRDIAAKKGLKPAIVIDAGSGMAGTNRPVLHEYMERMKENMNSVQVNDPKSTFNGYEISNITYAL